MSDAQLITAPEDLERVHEALLVPNFPAAELITSAELIEGVTAGVTTVYLIGTVQSPTAVAVTDRFSHSHAVLLSYLAIHADQRGRGVGTSLMRELLATIHTDPEVSVVLAEVEHPGHHPGHEVHGDPAARLRFYERLGGLILDLPYFQPPIAAGADPVYAMLLLVLDPPEQLLRDGRLLPEAGLGPALKELMSGADPDQHPVTAVLAPTHHPDGVRALPVDRLAEVPVSVQR